MASLLLLGALCQGRDPRSFAEDIGDGGASRLKAEVVDAVNDYFRPIRKRRAEIATDRAYLRDVLARGNARANEIADRTLGEVLTVMGMRY